MTCAYKPASGPPLSVFQFAVGVAGALAPQPDPGATEYVLHETPTMLGGVLLTLQISLVVGACEFWNTAAQIGIHFLDAALGRVVGDIVLQIGSANFAFGIGHHQQPDRNS